VRKITMFAAAVAVLVLIGFDTWLSIRTLTPDALAGSTVNPLITTTRAKVSPISHDNDYLLLSD
jgi:hypothetical protein